MIHSYDTKDNWDYKKKEYLLKKIYKLEILI